ncbi:MAG: ribosome maturation factor RimP [Alphaproteobacteria bacterium]|nr:ribosome maturation factor RimP [Alphaproteobacteria bacterium]
MSKAIESRINALIAADIAAAGYDLVRVQITGNGKYATLQVMAERQNGTGMNVEDCAAISRLVSDKIEAQPDLAEKFGLEVSSPGIDRPLVRLKDYEAWQGHVAKVELGAPVQGKKRFQGRIARVAGDVVEFEADKAVIAVPFAAIEKAKLVLTDELLKAAQKAGHH